jgi:hypothetical protein
VSSKAIKRGVAGQTEEGNVDERPVWRQVFDAVDSELGPRLEQFVRTEQFADAMAMFSRLNERAMKSAADFNRQMLAFWGVPSRSDIADLKKQLEAVDRQLHKVNKALTEGHDGDR